jgi:hypothetical protein
VITVELAPKALRMLEEADDHWAGTLSRGDDPLLEDVAHAMDLLRETPALGIVVRRGPGETRRLLLRSGWHLYDSYRPRLRIVTIVAVYYARRGRTPAL